MGSILLDAHDIVATNGRKLYHHNSLALTLPEPVLVPGLSALKIFDPKKPAHLRRKGGKDDRGLYQLVQHPWKWTFKPVEGPYPKWSAVRPDPNGQRIRFTLSENDAHRITKELSKLPLCKTDNAPVTLAVKDGRASLFAGEKQEYCLETVDWGCGYGITTHVSFNLEFLIEAVAKGLREVAFADPLSPITLRDKCREVFFMPLRTSHMEGEKTPFVPSPPAPTTNHTDRNNMQKTPPTNDQKEDTPPTGDTENGTPLQRLLREAGDLRDQLRRVLQLAREMAREHAQLEKEHESLKRNIRSLQRIEV